MKTLNIKRDLNDETRKQGVWMRMGKEIGVFSLHITDDGEAIITDDRDYTKIYRVESLDFFNASCRED